MAIIIFFDYGRSAFGGIGKTRVVTYIIRCNEANTTRQMLDITYMEQPYPLLLFGKLLVRIS